MAGFVGGRVLWVSGWRGGGSGGGATAGGNEKAREQVSPSV